MPKDTSKEQHSPGTRPLSTRDGGPMSVLKRNQACHQCRKRKLASLSNIAGCLPDFTNASLQKCDAKRPCSTCVRSHVHAVAHAPPGTELPSQPECTFDDSEHLALLTGDTRDESTLAVPENTPAIAEGTKSRYERLENRINELEALLHQKEQGSDSSTTSPPLFETLSNSIDNSNGNPDFSIQQGQPFQDKFASNLDTIIGGAYSSADQSFSYISEVRSPTTESATGLEMVWPNWPLHVPRPDLLRHLVEMFFAFHPHATRLFHAPSFMASLSLPPTHPKFPIPPVLHAICAVSTLYTAAVSSPPLPNYSEVAPNEIFQQKYRAREGRPDSFAEEQARWARETIDKYLCTGENLVQVLQANVILSWYFWCHAKWVEVFIASGHSLRMLVPLGLNMCPPFHSISMALRGASILPPSRTVVEDETRRNVFWLAYATDRTTGLSNGWAHGIDDEDVAQLLPVRGDQFNKGDLVASHERQWAHSKDVCLAHPAEQTDAFTLYIKGTSLISRVKSFNLRFRSRHYAGDPTCDVEPGFSDSVDPRTSQAFKDLDNTVLSFRASFPAHLRNPINGGVVDPHLYCASLFPHVCTILLHEPHAEVQKSGCISALRILTAARATLDLIYAVWSTSYDVTLMDLSCTFCWFMSGRVLIHFLKAAQETDSQDQILTLRTELEFIQLAISKVGERIPLAYMHAKLLHNATVDSCGQSIRLTGSDSISPQESSNLSTFGVSPILNTAPIVSW